MKKEIMDGNTACSRVAYNFSEVAGIYPITPASTMAELTDIYANNGKLNLFGDKVKVIEMQSEAGAIGTVHGLLQDGVLATTYTASQGLLLMIPNMYKIAGEQLPCVINVAARTLATHALSIMGDHSDIYATRGTGFAIFGTSSVQQVMDLTAVPYLSSLKGRIPFVNFFDGFRTSHEYNKINVIDDNIFKDMIDKKALNSFRKRSLDIDSPTTRGTNQGDSIYFQAIESRNKFYNELPDIVNYYMSEINKKIGTSYKPFNYFGDKNAKFIIIAMGSVCETIKEVIEHNNKGIGLVEVHLYRPFSSKYLLNVLPKTTKKIAVLDRSKESGANGEPLYLDICEAIKTHNLKIDIVGGRYGLSSKNTTPNDIESVYKFLKEKSNTHFTLGIIDDVTNLSLKPTNTIFDNKCKEILIYGYGSDGMVTTSKDILTIVGNNTEKFVQGYFEYDSKKSGGLTKCHLRFSDKEIRSTYYVEHPYLVVCTKDTYLKKYDLLDKLQTKGTFILNTEKSKEEINKVVPKEVINKLKEKEANFYILNATKIARENNIPNKISMIIEKVIFKMTDLIKYSKVEIEMKKMIIKNFSKKGQSIIDCNFKALNDADELIEKVDLNNITPIFEMEKVNDTIFSKLEHDLGNTIKVSDFNNREDGIFEASLAKQEKRGLSNIIPAYDKDKCIMCNLCSFVCPHAVIRPYLLNETEYNKAPQYVKETVKGANIKGEKLYFTVCISPLDCTGCSLCSSICPTKAIKMNEIKDIELKRYQYLEKVTEKRIMNKNTIKGSQFVKPKFEFSGACAGCGETPYLKLLSQLFGDNLMIANATGCSSIYGASVPSTPYAVAWANSLFEDNAEFGYGMRIAEDFMKEKVRRIFNENKSKVNSHNKKLINQYLKSYSSEVAEEVYNSLDYNNFKEIEPLKKYIKEKTIWCVGGDGWAYDIGFGGIDHVLSTNENINILVLDTEVYSNTGGQSSKSTRCGAIAKFASNGKETQKKDLALIAMCYPNCYVATISLGANYKQTIDVLNEAASFKGPSIVIAYAPCIAHGIKSGMQDSIAEEKLATEIGYFPLFRYNSHTKELKIDSKADFSKYEEIFKKENRYAMLDDSRKDLLNKNKNYSEEKYEKINKKDK